MYLFCTLPSLGGLPRLTRKILCAPHLHKGDVPRTGLCVGALAAHSLIATHLGALATAGADFPPLRPRTGRHFLDDSTALYPTLGVPDGTSLKFIGDLLKQCAPHGQQWPRQCQRHLRKWAECHERATRGRVPRMGECYPPIQSRRERCIYAANAAVQWRAKVWRVRGLGMPCFSRGKCGLPHLRAIKFAD